MSSTGPIRLKAASRTRSPVGLVSPLGAKIRAPFRLPAMILTPRFVFIHLHKSGGTFVNDVPVWNFASAQGSGTERYGELFRHLLERGVYIAPSQFEAMFVSTAHGLAEVERTVEAAREFLA